MLTDAIQDLNVFSKSLFFVICVIVFSVFYIQLVGLSFQKIKNKPTNYFSQFSVSAYVQSLVIAVIALGFIPTESACAIEDGRLTGKTILGLSICTGNVWLLSIVASLTLLLVWYLAYAYFILNEEVKAKQYVHIEFKRVGETSPKVCIGTHIDKAVKPHFPYTIFFLSLPTVFYILNVLILINGSSSWFEIFYYTKSS